MNEQTSPVNNVRSKKELPDAINRLLTSMGWLILLVAVLHFVVEVMVMGFLDHHPNLHPVFKALLDTLLLLSVLSVGLYLGYYRPARNYYQKYQDPGRRPRKPHPTSLLNTMLVEYQADEKSLDLLSPKRLVPLMVFSIFFAEVGVMFLLDHLPPFSASVEALFDATGLLFILSPTFYFFHYRPLQQHNLDRKKIIDQLSASEERLQLALLAVNDSLWDINLITQEIYVSPRGLSMLGFSPGEIPPTMSAWQELLHPEEREQVLAVLEEHLNGQTSHYHMEHRLRCKRGNWIWVLARGQVVEWSDSDELKPLRMVGTHTDITQHRQAADALRQSEAEVRALSHKLIHAAEEEKKRLSRDLHDEFGQALTAFQFGVEMLRDHQYGDEDRYQFHCTRLLQLVSRMETNLRALCDHLRPIMLEDVGLIETLRWHINEFSHLNSSLQVRFQATGEQRLSKELKIVLFRICQEALNNVAKHARASHVEVNLIMNSVAAIISIKDDGRGLDEDVLQNRDRASWGLGLLGMRERAAAVGGMLTVKSENGRGTTIRAEIPVRFEEGMHDDQSN